MITDRSEWHRPAALIRTSTSPGPGRIEFELFDDKRFGLRVRGAAPGGFENCCVDGASRHDLRLVGTLLAKFVDQDPDVLRVVDRNGDQVHAAGVERRVQGRDELIGGFD